MRTMHDYIKRNCPLLFIKVEEYVSKNPGSDDLWISDLMIGVFSDIGLTVKYSDQVEETLKMAEENLRTQKENLN